MDRFTRAIAMASARHPWRTIASWVLVLGAVFFLAASGGGTFTDDFTVPGSQSARALDLLDESFPEAAKGKVLVVFAAEDGETLESHRADVDAVLDRRRHPRPRGVGHRPVRGRHRLGGRPDRLRRADPRRAGARDGQAGVHRALERRVRRRGAGSAGRARRRRRVPQRRGRHRARGHRAPGRAARPAGRVRHHRGRPRADRPLDRRRRRRHRRHHAARRNHGRVRLRHPDRRPRRPRCRRRLRAVRRGPLPREPCRRPAQRPGSRERHGVLGRGRGLRRRGRRRRDGGSRPHRRRGPDVHRARHRPHGALRGRRRRHPASGAARPAWATASTAVG